MKRYLIAVLAGALAAAPAFAQYGPSPSDALVYQWYSHFAPQHGATLQNIETTGWPQALDQGQPPAKILSDVIGSQEYWLRVGQTPQGFVQTLFQDLTGRQPTQREFSYWASRMAYSAPGAPDYGELQDLAYDMLLRYPQTWQPAPAAASPYNTAPAPAVVVPPIYGGGTNYDYDYRRPDYHYYHGDRDHRDDNHRDDHHDDHRRDEPRP